LTGVENISNWGSSWKGMVIYDFLPL